jgi:hypothetical protein
MRHTRTVGLALLACLALALLPRPALAGGPLANCASGQPYKWPSGGANIPFNPDQGPLGPLDNAGAVALVGDAFEAWADVASSTATYANAGQLPVDVDVTNFLPYLSPAAPDGLSAIVFDDTGEIFDLLFGPNSGILGFAGPEWLDPSTCEILEGVSFLNGPTFGNQTEALDVMVHEFGHYTNLAHTVVNGQIVFFDDATDPAGAFPGPVAVGQIETMNPFYSGAGQGTATPHRDDVASISTLYPEPTFAPSHASIEGTILASNGTTRVSGVNVIARNVADPFDDAASALSGDRTDSTSQADPLTGTYRLNGLTPGAQYAVFVDGILAGGFSTPPVTLPGPEEFHDAGESNNVTTPDDPVVYTPVSAAAGGVAQDVDVVFNAFRPGEALPVGDDGFVELFPPFSFEVCGQEFASVFVNANGSLTFGAPSTDFSESVVELLGGRGGTSSLLAPPRVAALWDDLNAGPGGGGTVTFDETPDTFTVTWDAVPEYPAVGANTFSVTLKRRGNQAVVEYGDLSATDGLAGLACGSQVTSGFENERNLLRHGHGATIGMERQTAAFEIFTSGDNDLANATLRYVAFARGFAEAAERHAGNDDLAHAQRIHLPFTNASVDRFAEIAPVGGDVDYYAFRAKGGDILAIEVVRGSPDTMVGLFDADTGDLLLVDDDGGCCGIGGLSRLLVQVPTSVASIDLAVAVTSWDDPDFDGAGGVTGGRYVLHVQSYRGEVLAAGDDTSTEVELARPFFFQGRRWTSVFVNSNGNLTFGAGNTDFSESVAELLAGPPRIAPLWDDLNGVDGLVVAERGHADTTVHFVSVPEFGDLSGNYFSVKLAPLGLVHVEYGPTSRGDALVGVTEGEGAADPGETDLSAAPWGLLSGRGTTYELFAATSPPEPFDLSLDRLFFSPFF